jgi:hypothetical protein
MRRTCALFGLALIALLMGTGTANAADIPRLTWERSAMQEVALDVAISQNIESLELLGQSQRIQFAPQGITQGRQIYHALLPASFPLGEYTVRAYLNGGSSRDFGSVRVIEFQSGGYNPLTDVTTTTTLAVTFFALFATWASRDQSERWKERDRYADDETTLGKLDLDTVGRTVTERHKYSPGLVSSIALDHWRNEKVIRTSKYSTLISRIISDGGYLQFSLGSLVLFFPLIGLIGGALAFSNISGIGFVTTPSLTISLFLVALGAIDASAGFLASLMFGILALTNDYFASAYDVRTFLGLAILWISPALMANNVRAMRRSSQEVGLWERLADIVIGSVLTGWAVRSIVIGLNGFSHLTLPLSDHATTVGVVAGGVLAFRYLVEEYVNRRNPYYMAYLSPEMTHRQHSTARLISWMLRSILFLFFAISFLGNSWQLWIALALFISPTLISVFKSKFPNSSLLYQILPVGIPSIIVMTLIGRGYSHLIGNFELSPATATRTIFVMMALPGFVIGLLKLFGRQPKSGDVRWYVRPNMRVAYRVFGPVLFIIATGLVTGVI